MGEVLRGDTTKYAGQPQAASWVMSSPATPACWRLPRSGQCMQGATLGHRQLPALSQPLQRSCEQHASFLLPMLLKGLLSKQLGAAAAPWMSQDTPQQMSRQTQQPTKEKCDISVD